MISGPADVSATTFTARYDAPWPLHFSCVCLFFAGLASLTTPLSSLWLPSTLVPSLACYWLCFLVVMHAVTFAGLLVIGPSREALPPLASSISCASLAFALRDRNHQRGLAWAMLVSGLLALLGGGAGSCLFVGDCHGGGGGSFATDLAAVLTALGGASLLIVARRLVTRAMGQVQADMLAYEEAWAALTADGDAAGR